MKTPERIQLQKLMDDISEWSDKTFGYGQRNPAIIYHLQKEVNELIVSFHEFYSVKSRSDFGKQVRKTTMEYADCFILLFDSAHHFGLTAEEIIDLVHTKLEINKKRKWRKPDENGVVEHLKS